MATEGEFVLVSINISAKKGTTKAPVDSALLVADYGIEGDAHAGTPNRQVSLLAEEDIDTMRGKGLELHNGDFAENLTVRGVSPAELPLGARLEIGDAVLELTQIGKECHSGCEISKLVGQCVMPRRGVFARVVVGGRIDGESRCRYRF